MQKKEQEKSTIKQNISRYLAFKGISDYQFYKDTGVSRGVLSQNNGLSEDNLMRFLSYYSEVNPGWVVTGEGEMLLDVSSGYDFETGLPRDYYLDNRLGDLLNLDEKRLLKAFEGVSKEDLLLFISRNAQSIETEFDPWKKLDKVLEEFPEISPSWLIKGEGEMFRGGTNNIAQGNYIEDQEEYEKAKDLGVALIPEYTDTFRGGDMGSMISTDGIKAYWALPNTKADMVVEVEGDSMANSYPAGSKVAIRKIQFDREYPTVGIPFGEVFGIIVDNGDENYLTFIKRLRRHPDKALQNKYWIAQSDNKEYDDFEIDITKVRHLFIVVAGVKLTGY